MQLLGTKIGTNAIPNQLIPSISGTCNCFEHCAPIKVGVNSLSPYEASLKKLFIYNNAKKTINKKDH